MIITSGMIMITDLSLSLDYVVAAAVFDAMIDDDNNNEDDRRHN
jgi:hypothetical protein